jgi:hypothetical protein
VRVLALTDSLAPWHSFWIRFGQYAEGLPWTVNISNDVTEINELGPNDRLFFYRYSLDWGDLASRLQEARERGVLILSDLDDYLWQANGWNRERQLQCTRALRLCHRISCSTRPLMELVQVMLPGVPLVLLPNTAPKLEFNPESAVGICPSAPVRIGWTGAPWTRPADLALLRPVAAWIAQHRHQLQLVHVGHGEDRLSLADTIGLPSELVETHPLQGHSQYLQQLKFDIGLAPLCRSSFNHYKSAIKPIEYSCLGIPWIASDAEPYRELCEQWQWQGRLCAEPSAWISHVQALMDRATRSREGLALRQLCQQHASYASGVESWRQLLASKHWTNSSA